MVGAMSAPAYMLSLLGRQRQLLGARFFEAYLSDWLVWEPGPLHRARSILTSDTEVTHLPSAAEPLRPVGEDALCFELKQLAGASLIVGRGSENDIVVDDLTVSREQFTLHYAEAKWVVHAKGSALSVDGQPVGAEGAALNNGSVITAGDVRMTFYGKDGFPQRLELETSKA